MNNNSCDNSTPDGVGSCCGTPDGVDSCCGVRGRRCFCMPYDDAYLITAQVLSIVAIFVSWIWWVTFVVSLAGMVMIQVLWCCRQKQAAIFASLAVAWVCAISNLWVGIYVWNAWSNMAHCGPWDFWANNESYYMNLDGTPYDGPTYDDDCAEKTWASIAVVCGILWVIVFGCLMKFVMSGRHARWEEMHSNNSKEPLVVPEALAPDEPAAAAASVAIPLAESKEVD